MKDNLFMRISIVAIALSLIPSGLFAQEYVQSPAPSLQQQASSQQIVPNTPIDPFAQSLQSASPTPNVPNTPIDPFAQSHYAPAHNSFAAHGVYPTQRSSSLTKYDNSVIIAEAFIGVGISLLWGAAIYYWFDELLYEGHCNHDGSFSKRWCDDMYFTDSAFALSHLTLAVVNTWLYGMSVYVTDLAFSKNTTWWYPIVGAAAGALATALFASCGNLPEGSELKIHNRAGANWSAVVLSAVLPLTGAILSNYFLRHRFGASFHSSHQDDTHETNDAQRVQFAPIVSFDKDRTFLGIAGAF